MKDYNNCYGMPKPLRHKWNEDTCINCGVKRRTRIVYSLDMRLKKRVFDYLIDNKWLMINPICK